MDFKSTVLILPPNDAEAVMIREIARTIGLPMVISQQPHGATLDREPEIVELVRDGGWKRVVVVEMPGAKTEEAIRRLGVRLQIIDHHHYTNLNRAHDPSTGRLLPSSLEQFLSLFLLTDAKLKRLGFKPKLVRGIGIMDRGFLWALEEEGYRKAEVTEVLAERDRLMRRIRDPKSERAFDAIARRAWKNRRRWEGFDIVSCRANIDLRPRVSMIVARQKRRPTPLIVYEPVRKVIYVQESPRAMELFRAFGGFTFGMDRNWGYRMEKGARRVTLVDVKRVLKEAAEKSAQAPKIRRVKSLKKKR